MLNSSHSVERGSPDSKDPQTLVKLLLCCISEAQRLFTINSIRKTEVSKTSAAINTQLLKSIALTVVQQEASCSEHFLLF